MKKLTKAATLLLTLCLLMGALNPASAVEAGKSNREKDEQAIEKTISAYYEAREAFLAGERIDDMALFAGELILQELQTYRDLLGISRETASIVIQVRYIGEFGTEAYVYETVGNSEIFHRLLLSPSKERQYGWVIDTDGFLDESCGFVSEAYIDAEYLREVEELNAGKRRLEPDSTRLLPTHAVTTLLSVAADEVGYHEKKTNADLYDKYLNSGDNNYTKYGAWFGYPDTPWCAAFIGWCANQAGISTSIICQNCFTNKDLIENYYMPHGCYYTVSSGYTPVVGDIFFTHDPACTGYAGYHTGIIVSKSGNDITYIAGNESDQVKYTAVTLGSWTNLIGFAHPCQSGHSNEYAYNATKHWPVCKVCATTGSYGNHVWMVSIEGSTVCSICGAVED